VEIKFCFKASTTATETVEMVRAANGADTLTGFHMRFIGVSHSVACVNKGTLKNYCRAQQGFIVLSAIVITAKTTCFDLESHPTYFAGTNG
jgi:hypothetical protein